ncbi:2-oxoglutarate dehydrogenase complex dihydrolipoyllysine-residue succinyltransferase [Candidatus Odyssella acanthamoebae]|uniref:Dihydrolipoyllysine-residue succinyltransferase component of 2-oxoglutarate dehydrogenase complex n=1 Tax=Candidatus Odyssella acanthamoebae TaxID=91604 RepID=A0A077AVQ3_9PROT|nr:2-oxoglutarate dehydrogenase complex dihydrolipoyllysine-residue succinyltransferase [Candidatus Paracaedibacter acanthamoebae]AIK95743.1 dihydrolipoamide succinyltransferase [Candidatus Paracaedibacter acanthamoebae]
MAEHKEIKVPPLGESVSEATVARWVKKEGQAVTVDEILVELETDKVTLEVTAPASGVLSKIHHPEGATVKVGQMLGVVEVGAQAAVSAALPEEKAERVAAKTTVVEEKVLTAKVADENGPAVRKIAEEKNVNLSSVTPTGKDGRVTKGDVINHLETPARHQAVARNSEGREERVKMTRLRQRIAERLKHAQDTAAILTTFNEVDMTAVFDIRNRYKDSFEKKHGVKLGFMSFFVKAAIQALRQSPEINAEINGDEIIYKNYYDIGVAVSAPQGLVVPVVRDADQLSFAGIEKEVSRLGTQARDGKLTIDEMTGGTFTVSNGGIFGSLMSTPILNSPQTGILGMHKIQDRPVAINGQVVIRPMMYIALSYDHRLIDGREAVTFLVRIKENIENPERLLLDV